MAVYAGSYVENGMAEVLITDPAPPHLWDYTDDHLIAAAFSREAARLGRHWVVEPEAGIARRFGEQDETEVWGAVFLRYRGFPWDAVLTTSAAVSLGLNYATDISDVERERADDGEGNRLQHFFAPEITFALPSRPNVELLLRFHHRSGVFGLISDSGGGAQYGTIGLRLRF